MVLALLLTFLSFAIGGLVDHPIIGDSVTYLDGQWTASASDIGLTIPATVPGDLISDLQNAKIIPDPLYELNWKNSSLWDTHIWTYTTSFTLPDAIIDALEAGAASDVLLVFDGIKMGATISLNGQTIGQAVDEYLRYTFSLSAFLTNPYSQNLRRGLGANTISVAFDPALTVDGRYMACTGGWDWAPYSNTFQNANPGTAHTFSKGIWKSVYWVSVSSVALTHIVPHTFYTGSFPTSALSDGNHSPFNVTVRTHFWSPSSVSGTLQIQGSWGSTANLTTTISSGESNITLNLTATSNQINLWWPNGLGKQPLYNVSVSFIPADGSPVLTDQRRIGFRFFALVTGNDTDPNYVTQNANSDGTDNHGMYFRVNGVAFYSRGANMIPMEELEGRYNSEAHRILVQSSADAGMNTLRVWGGGVFLPDVWYDACDEVGIIVYHDMQYAQDGHSPKQTPTQESEFRHQIRRLSHHPSIVIWDGCNECQVIIGTDTGIYATFVLTVVNQEDASRVLWPSCPAEGWSAGVNRLSAIPNGSPFGLLPVTPLYKAKSTDTCTYTNNIDMQGGGGTTLDAVDAIQCCGECYSDAQCTNSVYLDGKCYLKYGGSQVSKDGVVLCTPTAKPPRPTTIETHGPYQHGSGFDCVNGDKALELFPSNIPITVNPTQIGLGYQNIFASEFGCVVMSSFESMSVTLDPTHWGIHAGMASDNCSTGFEKTCVGDNPMSDRNYPCDSIIDVYFGSDNFDLVGEAVFKKQLFQCMIGQALEMKGDIETRRSQNQFGCVVWQLNEIWPTGGWGSLEYGTPVAGQVLGGRWKPLHYWYKKFLYVDVFVTCGAKGQCFVRNDSPRPYQGTITLSSVELGSGIEKVIQQSNVSLAAGPGVVQYITIDISSFDPSSFVLTAKASSSTNGQTVANNFVLLSTPEKLNLPKANVMFNVSNTVNSDGSVNITVNTDATALFVTLTTLANGRFSDNAFLLLPPGVTIQFIPFDSTVNLSLLTSSLRVEHVASYQ